MHAKEDKMNRLSHFLVALLLGSLPTLALAQGAANFPNKSIRIVVGFGPGGPTDIFGRLYASHLERKYKQPIIVDNRPGAGQLVGADLVAKSASDGSTLTASTNILGFESLLNTDSPLDRPRTFCRSASSPTPACSYAYTAACPSRIWPNSSPRYVPTPES